MFICYYLLLSVTIFHYLLLSVIIYYHLLSFAIICHYLALSGIIFDHLLSFAMLICYARHLSSQSPPTPTTDTTNLFPGRGKARSALQPV